MAALSQVDNDSKIRLFLSDKFSASPFFFSFLFYFFNRDFCPSDLLKQAT